MAVRHDDKSCFDILVAAVPGKGPGLMSPIGDGPDGLNGGTPMASGKYQP